MNRVCSIVETVMESGLLLLSLYRPVPAPHAELTAQHTYVHGSMEGC